MTEQTVTTEVPATETAAATQAAAETADLGDAGKKAIDRMKQERDEARRQAKANADAAKRLADIEAASATDLEKAIAKTQQETETRVRTEVTRDRVLDRIEVLAAKDFADAEDARLRLAARIEDFVSLDGTIDTDGIRSALVDLLDSKPHLAAKGDGRPRGDADQGVRATAPLTDPRARDLAQIEADLKSSPRNRNR